VVLECAGHRRTELIPQPPGLPWACGAVGEARWTGTSLRTLLKQARIPSDASEVVLEGADSGEFPGLGGEYRFARSLPLSKAMAPDVLLAYEMNGEPISVERGGPVRAIVPGWYATDSVKWLTRIWCCCSEPFDGPFERLDYRFRLPGEPGPGRRLTELPVHSLITSPEEGAQAPAGPMTVRGVAWGGSGGVAAVQLQVDDGRWRAATLRPAPGRYARTLWELECTFGPGRHVLSSRAIDRTGVAQPQEPVANPGGYANNAVHRVAVTTSPLSP
jgi:DMSO/TMAO reductase YedYZ molybdopterin-dependent catalytic subunit